jgi:general stress protein 26
MTEESRSLEDIFEEERIVMFVTSDQRARPMAVLDRDGETLWFLTSRATEWVSGLTQGEKVTLTVSDPKDSLFVSLTGSARTSTDRERIDALWSPMLEAWFEGRDDPNITALQVDVAEGEYWDGPGTGVGRALRGLAGQLIGDGRRTMGEQGPVEPS